MKKVLLLMGVFFIMITILTGCGQAGTYYSSGKKSFAAGDYVKAAESFSAAAAKNPNRADYFIDYGLALTALGKYDEAIAQFGHVYMEKDMAIIRENNKRALRGKGIAYYDMKQYDKAVKAFEEALQIDELTGIDTDILYYMADCLKTSGSYDKAVKAYTAIISADGRSTLAYAGRAYCYQYLEDYEKSLADYDSAIALEPGNYEYYFGKYYLMAENNDKTGAEELLSQAEKIQAKTDADQYSLAKLHYLQGKYDTALTELNNCFTAGFTEAYYYIGEIYRIRNDYENAVYYYDNYINNSKVCTPGVYNQIAACRIKTGKYAEALEYLKKGRAYNIQSMDRIFRKNEIIAYENLGRFQDAGKKLEEYLAVYPEDVKAQKEAGFISTRIIDPVTSGSGIN